VEEVVATLTDLVRAGKIRHYGFSDTPAWYVARAHTLAEQQGKEGVTALQLEYSLIERNIEREHIPAAQELGIGICPWSPLGGGFLTGKYKRQGDTGTGDGRLTKGSPFNKFTDSNWRMLEVCWMSASSSENRPRKWPSVGGHAARHHLHHSGRQQPGAAQRQPGVARIHHPRRSSQTFGRSQRARTRASLRVLQRNDSRHDPRRRGSESLEGRADSARYRAATV
jgi:hypothetical protein